MFFSGFKKKKPSISFNQINIEYNHAIIKKYDIVINTLRYVSCLKKMF